MLDKIKNVLDTDIRQSLYEHEGDVDVISYDSGILKIKLLGRCSGCPSAYITTEEVIKKTLMEKIPEIKDVILVTEVNPELLAFAKKILSSHKES